MPSVAIANVEGTPPQQVLLRVERGDSTTAKSRPYLILDANAVPIGSLSPPRNVYIEAADRRNVWAIEQDSDGIPSIVRYHIAGT